MELKVTRERVLIASKKCSTAKNILKELFPEVFNEEEGWEDVTSRCKIKRFDDCEELRDRVGVAVPTVSDNHLFYMPFTLTDTWKGSRNEKGIPLIDGYLFKIHDMKILRKKEEEDNA